MISRRRWILGGASVVLVFAARARAQPASRSWRIGYLNPGAESDPSQAYSVLREALASRGYMVGRNLRMEARFADGQLERLPRYAAELVALPVDLIIAVSPSAIRAARDATASIPIVMAFSGDDPVRSGFVADFARPGGNVTGITSLTGVLAPKWIELMQQAVPGITRIGVLRSSVRPDHDEHVQAMRGVADARGIALNVVAVKSRDDYAEAFDEIARRQSQAIIILSGPEFSQNLERLATLAQAHRLPSLWQYREFVDAGGLLSYGPSIRDLTEAAAVVVDKIFRGAKPADLAVVQPTRYVLAINAGTARRLGITIPQSLLVRADEIVQ